MAGCAANQQQIANLEAEKAALQQQVASLEADKAALQQQVTGLEADKAAAEQKATGLEADKAAAQQQATDLEAAKATLEQQNQTLKDIAGPLPESLDNYFPPKAPAPVWLLEMFALSGAAEGIFIDLQQQDIEGAMANFEAFKAQYSKMAEMVPEWKDRFPMEPVEALGKALASGDPAQVGPAFGQVGAVCGSCHLVNQTKAMQKYHWPDFEAIELTDPVTNEKVSWTDYMFGMALAYTGMDNDLRQGQLDNARQNFEAFSAMFKALPTEGCTKCHDTPRTYFVDESVQAMVDQLGQALAADAPDAQAIGQLSGGIGNESCFKCHLVHLPAAHTKARWEAFADLFK
jgi:cytochrome c556